jgi:CDP-glucose 4,6-dehydratase
VENVVSSWHGRSTFITGATGLLGGWLVGELIAAGADVVVLVRDEVPRSYIRNEGLIGRCTVVRGELADLALMERALLEYSVDAVFHLAAQSQVGVAQRGPYPTMEANVRGTYTVLEAVRRTPSVRSVLVASSDKAYGEHEELPYTEDMKLGGRNPYDASKAAADTLALSYASSFELPIVVTRCGNLFGGGDLNWSRLVPGTVRSLLRGEPPVIRSDGTPVRDYLYARDAARAYLSAAERAGELRGEAFNFSLERPVPVAEMVRLVSAAVGTDIEPRILATATGEIPRQYLSSAKARQVLGWRPETTIEAGLRPTVEWYRSYFAGNG